MTTILSIQSSVAYGHVGNSAATFPLMRMGVEVWPVITVHFSNNTGYASWRGPLLRADDVREVVRGIDELGVLGECDAVLSGYQGAADSGSAILEAVALVKERNPAALYCCDPVLGDVGRGFFVAPGIPELMRDAVVPQAQVITPNQFELEFLTGRRGADARRRRRGGAGGPRARARDGPRHQRRRRGRSSPAPSTWSWRPARAPGGSRRRASTGCSRGPAT